MEHIVQFAIGIDDETIKKKVLETAEKKIIEDLTLDVKNCIFQSEYYSRNTPSKFPQQWVKNKVEEIIYEHKDQIIAEAVKELAANLSRTKAAKEARNKALEVDND